MIKHVGKHNQKRVAIVYRKVPDEGHMCLVMYTDTLPMMVHDEAMKCLESETGQQAKELADALFRHMMPDGNNCLNYIHRAGYLKKVPCNQVIVTPTVKSTCRLDELNDILDKLEAGGEAAQRLAEMDANRGMRNTPPEPREVGMPQVPVTGAVGADPMPQQPTFLSDDELAKQRLEQASKMSAEAKHLMAEAKRLRAEAQALKPAKPQSAQTKARNASTTKAKKVNA